MPRRSARGETVRESFSFDAGLAKLSVEFDLPNFQAMLARARDLRPCYKRLEELGWLDIPTAYERPDRVRGGVGQADKDGKRRNWGPGYPKRITKMGRTKRMWTRRSRRPYHPRTTLSMERRIAEASLRWIVTGVLP